MKVAIIIREFWPIKGGLTLHALRLAQELQKIGYTIEVFTPFVEAIPSGNDRFWKTEKTRTFNNEGVTTHVMGLNLLERLFLLPLKKLRWRDSTRPFANKMLQFIFNRKYKPKLAAFDIIHYDGGGMEFLGFSIAAVAKKLNKPFIIQPSIHLGHWGHLPVDHEFFRLADLMITHSLIETNYLINDVKIPSEKTFTVYNGIDDVQEDNPNYLRDTYNLQSKNIILFLGRKTEDKGIPIILDALNLVNERLPSVLICIGPGDLPEEFQGHTDIIDLGFVDEAVRNLCLASCDVLCVPSEGESFGLVYLEAGRAKKPIVARDLELFDDLLGENGQVGFRVGSRQSDGTVQVTAKEVANALIKIAADKNNSMGIQGYQNAARFLWPNIVQRFDQAYKTVLSEKNA